MKSFFNISKIDLILFILFVLIMVGMRAGDQFNNGAEYTFIMIALDMSFILANAKVAIYLYKKFQVHPYRYIILSFFLVYLFLMSEVHSNIFLTWLTKISEFKMSDDAIALASCWAFRSWNSHFVLACGFLASMFYYFYMKHVDSKQKITLLLKEKAEAESNLLKAQLNPHFLFNSMNSIYGLIDKENMQARKVVLKFSDLLRYQLYECNNSETYVHLEFQFLGYYIELQRIRLHDNVEFEWLDKESCVGFKIPPLILICFVENAFKYVSKSDHQRNFILIKTHNESNQFYFMIINSTEQQKPSKMIEEGGIGINNVKRRLDLTYENNYNLNIKEQDGVFEVLLTLPIKRD